MHRSCNRPASTSANGNGRAGAEARTQLRSLLGRGEIHCTWSARDRVGRALATCSADGIADVGEAMVRNGYAVDFDSFTGRYGGAEAEAAAARRGIWHGSFERPQEWRDRHPRQSQP